MTLEVRACLAGCVLLAGCATHGAAPAGKSDCQSGMVAYWNFDEGTGAAARDAVSGEDGPLRGPVWTAEGKVNSALDFDGNDFLRIHDRPSLRLTKAVTVAAWVKYRTLDLSDSGARLFCKGGGYCFVIGGPWGPDSRLAVYLYGSTSEWRRGNTPLEPEVWNHAAFSYDGANIVFYLNGVADGAVASAGDILPSTYDAFIGWDPAAAPGYHAPLDGTIDEVAVYGKALAPADIAELYSRGR